jgi:hypothetical protein
MSVIANGTTSSYFFVRFCVPLDRKWNHSTWHHWVRHPFGLNCLRTNIHQERYAGPCCCCCPSSNGYSISRKRLWSQETYGGQRIRGRFQILQDKITSTTRSTTSAECHKVSELQNRSQRAIYGTVTLSFWVGPLMNFFFRYFLPHCLVTQMKIFHERCICR